MFIQQSHAVGNISFSSIASLTDSCFIAAISSGKRQSLTERKVNDTWVCIRNEASFVAGQCNKPVVQTEISVCVCVCVFVTVKGER